MRRRHTPLTEQRRQGGGHTTSGGAERVEGDDRLPVPVGGPSASIAAIDLGGASVPNARTSRDNTPGASRNRANTCVRTLQIAIPDRARGRGLAWQKPSRTQSHYLHHQPWDTHAVMG